MQHSICSLWSLKYFSFTVDSWWQNLGYLKKQIILDRMKKDCLTDPSNVLLSDQPWARIPRWWFLLWRRDREPHWPAGLLVAALDPIWKSPGSGQEEGMRILTFQETSLVWLLTRWLVEHSHTPQLWCLRLQPLNTFQMSHVRSTSRTTSVQRRLWL